jgi:hypothetical protein
MLPKIGDKFYIPDAAREFYCVKGGLATVEKIADDRPQHGVKVKFAGIDTHWYTLEYIRENQAKWAEEYAGLTAVGEAR